MSRITQHLIGSVAIAALSACSRDASCTMTSPTFTRDDYSMHVGEAFVPAWTQGNSCGLPVSWAGARVVSLDTMILSVDSTGKVYARAVGVGELSDSRGHTARVTVLP
jgi:hypothetical protein